MIKKTTARLLLLVRFLIMFPIAAMAAIIYMVIYYNILGLIYIPIIIIFLVMSFKNYSLEKILDTLITFNDFIFELFGFLLFLGVEPIKKWGGIE